MSGTKKQLSMFGHLACTLDGAAECYTPDGKCSECQRDFDAKKVEQVYNEFWKELIEKDGEIDIEQLKKELYDYHNILDNVPQVYCHITKDRMSKPNYLASEVIAVADDCASDDVAEAINDLKKDIKDFIDGY